MQEEKLWKKLRRKPESSQISQHPREFARSQFKTLPQLKEKNYFKLQPPPNPLSYLKRTFPLQHPHAESARVVTSRKCIINPTVKEESRGQGQGLHHCRNTLEGHRSQKKALKMLRVLLNYRMFSFPYTLPLTPEGVSKTENHDERAARHRFSEEEHLGKPRNKDTRKI